MRALAANMAIRVGHCPARGAGKGSLHGNNISAGRLLIPRRTQEHNLCLSFTTTMPGVDMPLLVISVLFSLSLLAAWVLFNVLKSTAKVTKPEYQLGGAAAGFTVILTLLALFYIQVDNKENQDTINSLNSRLDAASKEADKGRACLSDQTTEVTYSGTVSPAMDAAYVVLGISSVQLQQDGKFAIKVRNVKPSDLPYLYVIGADSRAPYRQVFETDDPKNLAIPH